MKLSGFFHLPLPKMDIAVPAFADVSESDYEALKFEKNGDESDDGEQRPFIICHPLSLCAKVETWLGKTITWTFEAGKDPIPLRKIYMDPVPLVVEDGEATDTEVTTIQVGY